MIFSNLLFGVILSAVPCGSQTGCVVDVEIEGTELRLRVDTGADVTVLTKSAASRSGLRLGQDNPVIILSGASQTFYGKLVRAKVKVDEHEEDDVMVVVAPSLDVDGADGLLGMSYLERFKTSVGSELELTPIDVADKDRRGGRGEKWWRLRFRKVRSRRAVYERALAGAKEIDQAVEAAYGRSASGDNLTSYIKQLHDFMSSYEQQLQNHASRFSVPRAWRR